MDKKFDELEEKLIHLKAKSFDYLEEAKLFKQNYEALIVKVCEIFSMDAKSLKNIDEFFEQLEKVSEKLSDKESDTSVEEDLNK